MPYTSELVRSLLRGELAVIPTDTLYGLVACADNMQAVERVYDIKQRDRSKACIVLIDSPERILDFGVAGQLLPEANNYWPGPVSLVMPVDEEKWHHITRGLGTIAFRVPGVPALRELLAQTGPLIAPSANPESLPVAKTIDEAEAYFGDKVQLYIDGDTLVGKASTIIDLTSHKHLRD